MTDKSRRGLLKLSPLLLASGGWGNLRGAVSQPDRDAVPLVLDVRTSGANLSFSIRLKSRIHLYLSAGSVVLAASSPKPGETTGELGGVYDAAEANGSMYRYQDYGHNHWHNSLIWAESEHDIGISGHGLIYGKGLSFGWSTANEKRGDYPFFKAEQAGAGNKAIAFKNCRNVTLQDFKILKGGHFGILLTGVDDVKISDLTIDTDRDGIDLDCCRNVHVSRCTVNSPWDDAICPKSSLALGYPRATENVTISDCIVSGPYQLGTVLDGTYKAFAEGENRYRTGRIKCGTESNGGFRNITITNCVFDGCESLSLESVDGALCEDVTISNITMRNLIFGPIFFRLGARLRGPKDTTTVGRLRRILVSNVVSSNSSSEYSCVISGIPDAPIEDIKITNMYMEHQGGRKQQQGQTMPPEMIERYPDPNMFGSVPAHGFFLRHLRNLEMSHVEIAAQRADQRPSFVLHDVVRADFLAVNVPREASMFRLRDVRDFRVHLSRPVSDTVLANVEEREL